MKVKLLIKLKNSMSYIVNLVDVYLMLCEEKERHCLDSRSKMKLILVFTKSNVVQ